jgi:CDP-diglyceride synthetase
MGYEIIIQALWLVLPAYIANASALLVGGGKPIDFGKNWKDGKRILGDGKTWSGLITGAFVGMTCGFGFSIVAKYAALSDFAFLGINDYTGFPFMIPIIASICFGALI